jgi:hypothetical protein
MEYFVCIDLFCLDKSLAKERGGKKKACVKNAQLNVFFHGVLI